MTSSNPTAHQAVAERAGALDINKPTVKEEKDRDVKRKLKIYEAVKAIQAGHLPTNAQIDTVLRKAIEHQLVAADKLSPASRQIEEDIDDVLQTLRTIIKVKNENELIQEFVHESKGPKLDPISQDLSTSISKQQAKEDASSAAEHLRTVVALFIQNAEFRKVVFDLGVVGRDVLATSAVKIAEEKIRPTEEQLRGVGDEASADHPATTPVALTKAGQAAARAKDGVEQAKGGAHESRSAAGQQAQEGVQAAREEKTAEWAAKKKEQGKEAAEETGLPADRERTKRTVKERFHEFRERFSNDDESDKMRAQRDKASQFLADNFPQERREQFLFRLKKAVLESQKRDEYDEAVSALLDMLDEYAGHAGELKTTAAGARSDVSADPAFQRSFANLKVILARLAGRPLDGVIAAVDQLYADARKDEDLRAFWRDVDAYVRKALLEPGYIVEDECARDGRALRDRADVFFKDKYAHHKESLFDEIAHWLKGFSEDPLNARLGTDIQRLAKDLLFNEEGSLVFKAEVFDDFRLLLLPTLIDHVGYIPIPRIEYTDRQVDLVIENLVLRGETLFPNFIDVETSYHVHFSPTKPSAVGPGASRGRAVIQLSQIQCDLRDVAFSYTKKSGFPKLKDAGVADCLIGGQGISATVVLETAPAHSQSVFVVKSVEAKVGTLKVAVRRSAHDFFYKVVMPLATGLIKKRIAHSVEKAIRTALEYADGQLHSVRAQIKEAALKPGASKVDAFSGLLKKQKAEGEYAQAKVEAKAEETHGRVTIGDPVPAQQLADTSKSPRAGNEDWKSTAFDFL